MKKLLIINGGYATSKPKKTDLLYPPGIDPNPTNLKDLHQGKGLLEPCDVVTKRMQTKQKK